MIRKTLLLIGACSLVSCTSSITHRRSQEKRPQVQRVERPPRISIPQLPSSELFRLGQKSFNERAFSKAVDYFEAYTQASRSTPDETKGSLWMLRALSQTNRFHETSESAARLLGSFTWQPTELKEIFSIRVRSLEIIQDYIGALRACHEAISSASLESERDAYSIKGQEIIETHLSLDDLKTVAASNPHSRFRAVAAFRLAEVALENKNPDEARSYFSLTVSLDRDSEWGGRAQELLTQLEALRRVDSRTIGAVLPLTGKNANQGQRILRGIQLGLGLYENQSSSFKLAIADSEGNSDSARRGVDRLVKEDNVVAIVGSVLSKNADTVASKTSEYGVPSIALSQKAGVTEIGETVFRNAMTSEMQVRLLVKTAMEDLSMKKFAILFPNDLYGVEFANIFWDEVLARGGQVTAAQTYSPKETDFRGPIQRLVNTYYSEDRDSEYRARLADWSKAQKNRTARVQPPDDLLPPMVDFDAIFIPDSVRSMGQIAAMLSYNGVKNVHLLGTQLWNVPGVAKRAGNFANSILFVDSIVPSDAIFAKSQFVRTYKSIFNEEPGSLEAQAYDSALILRQLIAQGNTSRESLTRALSKVKNLPGSFGPLTVSDSREIQRPLIALTLKEGQIEVFSKKQRP